MHNNLGVALRAEDQHDKAVVAYRRARALAPGDPAICINLGRALAACGYLAQSRSAFARAASLAPHAAAPWLHLGVVEQEFGHVRPALAAFDQALRRDQACVSAWYSRSDLKTFVSDDPDIARMEALLPLVDRPGVPPDDPINLRFALGKAWLDVGDDDRAFACFHEANRRKRAGFAYDIEADIARMGAIAEGFTPEVLRQLGGLGDPSETPVFIIGLPRSGSSLVEQILASHPDIAGIGETAILTRLAGSGMAVLAEPGDHAADGLAQLARAYLGRVSTLAPGRLRVVDKELSHLRLAGLIHLMLPNARIIQCGRDLIDTCLSCYTHRFGGDQPFAYDLGELGRYARGAETLMAHWRAVLPGDRLMDVAYEDVVEDLEGQARRLVAFCGLPWDPACLRFHETSRAVRSSSSRQVRQALYGSSVGRWRRFERHLGPLLAALEGKDFFSEEKKQKTLFVGLPPLRMKPSSMDKKFFGSFSPKKNRLLFL